MSSHRFSAAGESGQIGLLGMVPVQKADDLGDAFVVVYHRVNLLLADDGVHPILAAKLRKYGIVTCRKDPMKRIAGQLRKPPEDISGRIRGLDARIARLEARLERNRTDLERNSADLTEKLAELCKERGPGK